MRAFLLHTYNINSIWGIFYKNFYISVYTRHALNQHANTTTVADQLKYIFHCFYGFRERSHQIVLDSIVSVTTWLEQCVLCGRGLLLSMHHLKALFFCFVYLLFIFCFVFFFFNFFFHIKMKYNVGRYLTS